MGRFLSADPLELAGLLVAGQTPGHEEALLPRAAAWALRGPKPGLMRVLRETWQRAPHRLNAYAYAANNPLSFTDPSGLAYGQGQCGENSVVYNYDWEDEVDWEPPPGSIIDPNRPTNPWSEAMYPPPLL